MRYYKYNTGKYKTYYNILFFLKLFLLFTLLNNKSFGQQQAKKNAKEWLLGISVPANRHVVTDKKFSALSFSGMNAGAAITIKYKHGNTEHDVTACYAKGNLSTNGLSKSTVTQSILNIDYANLYPVYTAKNNLLKLKLGAGLQFMDNKRVFKEFINLNRSFETVLSIGPIFQIAYNLTGILTGFSISNRFTIPLAGIMLQPAYAANFAEGQELNKNPGIGTFFKTAEAISLNKFFCVKNSLVIEKTFNGKHTIGVKYNWAYYKINTNRVTLQANHQLGIAYQYKL
jgi:hypothetical protein